MQMHKYPPKISIIVPRGDWDFDLVATLNGDMFDHRLSELPWMWNELVESAFAIIRRAHPDAIAYYRQDAPDVLVDDEDFGAIISIAPKPWYATNLA